MSTQDTFISHLVELRDRLLRAILAVLVVFLCLFPWAKDLYTLLAQPLLAVLPQGGQMIATDVVGVFLVPMKVALLVAFVIALPYVLFQIWAFVAPGLYAHEKRLVLPLIFTSTLLFIAGMAFAYFLVFPVVFKFMASIAPEGVAWMTDLVNGDCGVFEGMTSFAAVAGYPSITVPAGFVQELPVGMSFFGRPFAEPTLIKIAYAFEQATKARKSPKFLQTFA